ncbi:M13 family metallopeptidase [Silvibacterium acidisoli]|uniref:M13 family metallopeptidase n=1 Tax=Acidobacteriaceae bacterium ZG23-2 TaxID=2883246 RepID=UPI00406CE2B8
MQTVRFASALVLSAGLAFAQPAASPKPDSASDAPVKPKAVHSFDISSIDKTADPCTDFYAYACGNWRKNNPIPSDQSRWGRFNELNERNRYLLYEELDRAANDPKTALQKQYGSFYAACMDTDLANRLGDKPVLPVLAKIDALNDKKGLGALVADLHAHDNANGFFEFGSSADQKNSTMEIAEAFQGGLTLPDRDYYLLDDDRMTKIRSQYKEYVVSLFKLAGDNDDKAASEADAVLKIETALAKGSMARVDLRDPDKRYHMSPVTDLGKLAPDFNWVAYLQGIPAPAIKTLNIGTPDFFKAMNDVIDNSSLDTIKSYLRFHALNSSAPWLSQDFADLNFGFFKKTLQGQDQQSARWKRCTALTDANLGEAVGQDWVKENFPPKDKADMEKLVDALDKALGEDISQLSWMTPETKKAAEAKLALFRRKIGYPENWRDYSKLEVKRDDLVGNLRRADAFETAWELGKIGKPVDEKEWGMTPPTVNAYYDPSNNDINFPAGILQPPFYDDTKDAAVNFGGIGVVIGHEMTHGFDDEGSKYDGHGNVQQWWTPNDRAAFDQRTGCEVNEYGSFEPVPGQKLNGKLTLGENTADNGGIRIAYRALMSVLAEQGGDAKTKKVDGYTPEQQFFISFAQVWCENRTDAYSRMAVKVDPHSPGRFRTNGTVQNFDEFGKAFGCKKGQPMMPNNPCVVW